MSLSSYYGCPQKEIYRKKYLRAARIYGHWHSSLENSLTGAPCPCNSLTSVAFWLRSVSAPAVGFWAGSQYQARIPSSGAGLTFDQKVFSYRVGDSPPLSHRTHLASVELSAEVTVEWDPLWQFSQAAFAASLERCGLVNREEASSQVPAWFLYVLWPEYVVSPKLECYCIVLVGS